MSSSDSPARAAAERLIDICTPRGQFQVWTRRVGDNPRCMDLLMTHHDVHHVLRLPAEQWPDPVQRAFAPINPEVYSPMQGPANWAPGASC